MKTKLMCAMAVACAAIQLTAMPTEEEARRAEPVVKKMLAQERAALESGKMTRSEVAAAAMKLADEADTDAAKLLLMKGAFTLYVKDGNLEKAVETMKTLEAAISDMPPQSVTNMIEMALKGFSKKEDGERLYKLLDETRAGIASHSMSKEAASVSVGVESVTEKARKDIARLFPGWSLASEVPQRAEAANHYSGFYASHRGQDNIIRLHPVNRETPVVLSRTVKLSSKNPCLFLRIASWDEESDFLLSVRVDGKAAMPDRLVCTSDVEPWEDLVVPLFDWRGRSVEIEIILSANNWWCEWSHLARIEIAEGNGQEKYGLTGIADLIVDGYTWSYRVRNGEATIVAEKNGKYSCAVSPMPTGDIVIPTTLGGVKVTRIGRDAFANCQGLTSINIPQGVTSIDRGIFWNCSGLKSVALPSSLKTIGMAAFGRCAGLTSVTIPNGVTNIGKDAFQDSGIKSVTIPSSVTNIGISPLAGCRELMSLSVDSGNPSYSVINGVLCTKDGKNLVAGVNGSVMIPSSVKNINRGAFCAFGRLTSVDIPEGVTNIGYCAFCRCGFKTLTIPSSIKRLEFGAFWGCGGLKSVTLNEGVTHIEANAFWLCRELESVTIPSSVKSLAKDAFSQCGALTSVTMRGERPISPYNIFPGCGKLKAIHVPANAKSWAGMKEWFGIPLAFDGVKESDSSNPAKVSAANVLTGPYGIRVQPDPGCEKGAEYVLKRLVEDYLPAAVRYYGDPFRGKEPSRVFTLMVTRNDGKDRKFTGPSWGGRGDGVNQFTIGLAKGSDKWDMDLALVAELVLTVCREDVGLGLYVNDLVRGDVKGIDPVPDIKEKIRKGLSREGDEKKDRRLGVWREYAPMWSVFEELRARHPNFILDYCDLKNSRYAEGKLPQRLSFDQMVDLLGEATGENMAELFKKYGAGKRESQKYPLPKINNKSTSGETKADGFWTVAQYNGTSSISSLAEAQKIVDQSRKVAERTYQTLSFGNNDDGRGDFPHVEFPGTVGSVDLDHFVITAKGCIYVPHSGDWTFACRSDDGFRFVISGNELSDTFEHDAIRGFWQDTLLHTVHFPCAGIYSVTCLFFENWGNAGLEYSVARGRHPSFDSSKFKLVGDPESGIVMVGDAKDVGLQAQAEGTEQKSPRLRTLRRPRLQAREEQQKSEVKLPYEVVNGAVVLGSQGWFRLLRRPSLLRRPGAGDDRKYTVAKFAQGALVIPDVIDGLSVRSIGYGAFSGCKGLKSVAIPSSVTNIVDTAFSGCNEIMSFSVDASNPSYSSRDGLLCSKDGTTLVAGVNGEVTIPPCVKSIGKEAFNGRNGLKSVTIPGSVTSIDGGAFKNCGALVSVVMPSGLKKIGSDALWGCGELTSLPLPQGLTEIGENAFRGLGKLTSVTIPESVTRIDGAVFSYCGGLTQINVEAGNQKYASVDGVLYTKDLTELVMCPGGLKAVTIPESLTSIGRGAFVGCSKLTSLMLPSSVKSIGGWAFQGCNRLTSVTIPEGVTGIGQYAFNDCGELTSVTMRGERPEAPNNTFNSCGKLKSIHVPANAKSWEGMKDWLGIPLVFDAEAAESRQGQSKTSEVKLSYEVVDGAVVLGSQNRLYNLLGRMQKEEDGRFAVVKICSGALVVPDVIAGLSVRGIGNVTFPRCSSLTSVEIPSSVTNIEEHAFYSYTGRNAFNVAGGNPAYKSVSGLLLTKDGKTLVYGVNGNVAIPDGVKSIGLNAFRCCRELIGVTIPDSVTIVGGYAFLGCNALKDVSIGNGVTSIEDCAFSFCSGLTSVTIGKNVTRIGGCAFSQCGGLTSVTMRGERPEAPNNIFMRCDKLKSIHVPGNAKSWEGMKDWLGIPLVFDAEDTYQELRRLAAEIQRRKAERQAQEAEEKRQREAEREEARRQLLQIQEELRKAHERQGATDKRP